MGSPYIGLFILAFSIFKTNTTFHIPKCQAEGALILLLSKIATRIKVTRLAIQQK
jgi:hypothetical protein